MGVNSNPENFAELSKDIMCVKCGYMHWKHIKFKKVSVLITPHCK